MTEKAIIYIAGPMRGKKFYNFKAFDDAADMLEQSGWTVLSPTDMDREVGFDAFKLPENSDWTKVPPGFDFEACVARDTAAILKCDAIYLLDGWEHSRGARAEKALAEWRNCKVIYQIPPRTDGEYRHVDVRTGGEKGIKLARYDLIPMGPLRELAEHYGKNCKEHGGKYDANNWRRGYDWHLSFRSAVGHLQEFWSGKDLDPENNSKHVIAAAWHCLALAEFMDVMREKDDRPTTLKKKMDKNQLKLDL